MLEITHHQLKTLASLPQKSSY